MASTSHPAGQRPMGFVFASIQRRVVRGNAISFISAQSAILNRTGRRTVKSLLNRKLF